jgi:hypothetical protein
MITSLSRPQFISRIFTDVSGRQFRLNFFVAVVGGEIRGHLLSVEPISSSVKLLSGEVADGSICLPIVCSDTKPVTAYISPFIPVVSPYTELYFFNSQPTRAPSRI